MRRHVFDKLWTNTASLSAFACALVISLGCTVGHPLGSTTQPQEEKTKTVTVADRDGKIDVKQGEKVKIVLASHLSTGQTWRLKSKKLKSLKLVDGYPKYENGGGKPGAEEEAVFLFDALKPGADDVVLEEGRPNTTTDTFKVTVHVAE